MNKFYITLLLLLSAFTTFASHIVGGEMIYEYLAPGNSPNSKKYRITLLLYRDNDCMNCANMPTNVFIGIYNNDNNNQYPGRNAYYDVDGTTPVIVDVRNIPSCIINPPQLNYEVSSFAVEVELPDNLNGYTAAYQTCCRVSPLSNVINNIRAGGGGGSGTGATYSCNIPGSNQIKSGETNSSPQFTVGVDVICHDKKFKLDFSAKDPDGDSLVYSFCPAFNGGRTTTSNNVNPDPPPYTSVEYIAPYSDLQPLGKDATIDPQTGIISGFAPAEGEYVVSVSIDEYRQGKLISTHRKDFIVNVNDCDFAGARLLPEYKLCNTFSYSFTNLLNSPLNKTYLWDFGIPNTSDDTSQLESPTFTFPDTGVYTVKLVINPGQECQDSAFGKVSVFPGFVPAFNYSVCFNNPTRFRDSSYSKYGTVNSWFWNFGNAEAASETSQAQNPVYTYQQPGIKKVSLIVTDSKGCIDSVSKEIFIMDKPFAGRDTSVVAGQQLQFNATGGTDYLWTPATDLSNPNINNPVGIYDGSFDKIQYKVLISTPEGCMDSAFVAVRIFKTAPQVFVPTAFTPNGDGRNDVFRPIAAGMSRIDYFRVYNRWGQLVFSTTENEKGWDGKVKGQEQASGVYVWLVKGVDYTGKVFFAKGTVTLIK